ncbi:MAG: hypothetical protein IJZ68_08290 [Bacteroidaceae bacterium]|nr:hypothetical protein [Bacteroidaceae bacterium]
MSITAIIFTLSFSLFVAYTVVSLAFLNKKRTALHDELHGLVAKDMTDCFGRVQPDPEIALQLLKNMDGKFQKFNEESREVNLNVIKLSLLTAGVGVCTAISMILA